MLFWYGFGLITAVIASYGWVLGSRFLRYRRASKGILTGKTTDDITPPETKAHILILGDSTMYSAGVRDPAYTISGLFAGLYPEASIETRAANGARCRDVASQLAAGKHTHYDIIMIGIGGNDVVRFTPLNRLRLELNGLLDAAANKADKVLICSSVNVGNIGFFPFPLNYLYDARSKHFARTCQTVTATMTRVQFIDFYRPLHNDHYDARTRSKFVASDGFHANEYANKYFFDLIVKEAGLTTPFRRAGDS